MPHQRAYAAQLGGAGGDGARHAPRASAQSMQWMADANVRNGLLAADAMGIAGDERLLVGGAQERSHTTIPRLSSAPTNAYSRVMQMDPGAAKVAPFAPRTASYSLAPAVTEVGTVHTTASTAAGLPGVARDAHDGTTYAKDSAARKRSRAVASADARHDAAVAREAGFAYGETPHVAALQVEGQSAAAMAAARRQPWQGQELALGRRAATAMDGPVQARGGQTTQALPGARPTFLTAWKAALLPAPAGGGGGAARGQCTACPSTPIRITFWVATLLLLLIAAVAAACGVVAATASGKTRPRTAPAAA